MSLTEHTEIDGISSLFGDEKFRFCMVDSENRQRSSDWVIWESAGSLYVAVLNLGGVMKLSLHPSGSSNDGKDIQFGTTRRFWERSISNGFLGTLPFHRWKRPDSGEKKIVQVASVAFATQCLQRVMQVRKLSHRKVAFPLPGVGMANEISIFSHRLKLENAERILRNNGFMPMVDYELANGEHAAIAARVVEFRHEAMQIMPAGSGEMSWIGSALDPGGQIKDAHAIAILDWPLNGQPLLLTEVNGFNLSRSA